MEGGRALRKNRRRFFYAEFAGKFCAVTKVNRWDGSLRDRFGGTVCVFSEVSERGNRRDFYCDPEIDRVLERSGGGDQDKLLIKKKR